MSFKDRTLICRDCGVEFIFTAGEQEFYAQKGFLNDPVRCPECRKARKHAQPQNTSEDRRRRQRSRTSSA